MNKAIIFAGGTGARMNSKGKPKQFLELHSKPIIIYTLEIFENHPDIDGIIVVCLGEYIQELKKLIERYQLSKISAIVPGGQTGFDSIFNGLSASACRDEDIVLIHDGVRPLVCEELITRNIECAKENGNAITAVPVIEGIMISNDGQTVDEFPDRKLMFSTKAPQTFRFGTIIDLYKRAKSDGFVPIESAYLCKHYGVQLHLVIGSYDNIKITTPTDFYIFRAIHEAIENNQIAGI